jgi:hypothetical protein
MVKNRLVENRMKAVESRVLISSYFSKCFVDGFVRRVMTLLYVKPPAKVATTASELAIPRYADGTYKISTSYTFE